MKFTAKIYKVGINPCVDVPRKITAKLSAVRGQIKVVGKINGFDFKATLMPVKDGPHRLYVNLYMLQGGKTAVGKSASFDIRQNLKPVKKVYRISKVLREELKAAGLEADFKQLTVSRKQEILKYLGNISREETMKKNVSKLLRQLRDKVKSVRLP
jgi:hypothetical protein